MNSLFVDPVIATTPPEDASRDEVVAWLNNLTTWLKEALGSHMRWFHFVQATYLLDAQRRFPNFDNIRFWQRKYKLDVNPALIARDVDAFFRDENRDLGSNFEQLGYLVEAEEGSIRIRPEEFANRWLPCIRREMKEFLITLCSCLRANQPFLQGLSIVTLRLADNTREIEVSATIVDALPASVRETSDAILQRFPLLFTPDDLLPLQDIVALWSQGEAGILYAIAQQFKKVWQQSVDQPLQFRLGPRFLESVQKGGLGANAVVLTKIVRMAAAVIADSAVSLDCDLRQIRSSKSGNSPQLTRQSDGAEAWRLTLIKHGAGWRMHYWRIPSPEGSIIEFANVLKEQESVEIY